jgi:hypothetical protein
MTGRENLAFHNKNSFLFLNIIVRSAGTAFSDLKAQNLGTNALRTLKARRLPSRPKMTIVLVVKSLITPQAQLGFILLI